MSEGPSRSVPCAEAAEAEGSWSRCSPRSQLKVLTGAPAPLLPFHSLFPRRLLAAAHLGKGKDHSRRIYPLINTNCYLKPVWFGDAASVLGGLFPCLVCLEKEPVHLAKGFDASIHNLPSLE